MGRPGVTYEAVRAKAEEMLSVGITPTQRQVRAALGSTGSMETLARHLRRFWAERHGESSEFAISREFTAAIQAEFTRVANTTASELAGRARQAELELEECSARFSELTAAHDEQRQRLQRVEQDLRGAEGAAAQLRSSEAATRDDLRIANQRLADAHGEIQRLAASAERATTLEAELREAREMLRVVQSQVSQLLDENRVLRTQKAVGRRRAKDDQDSRAG